MESLASLFDRPGYDESNLAALKLLLGVLALAALAVEAAREAEGNPVSRLHKKRTGAALAVIGVIAFFQFFQFGYRGFYHRWEIFHDYLGMRYHRELGYEKLYDCVAVAESELPDGLIEVKTRKLRDLRTRDIVETAEILGNPDRCKGSFEPRRWEVFREDVAFFRKVMWGNYWRDAQKDHGYASPPGRTLLGELMIGLLPDGPATTARVQLLAAVDLALFALMFGLVAWAFGWRLLCLAVTFWGVQDLSPFYWNGGAFLRQDWLFFLIAAVCLARKKRFAASGILLALSFWMRGISVLFFMGPLLLAGAAVVRDRRLDRRLKRFFAGAALAGALVAGATHVRYGSTDLASWVHHVGIGSYTPVDNLVGWRSVVVYDPSTRMQVFKDRRIVDPFAGWQKGRHRHAIERAWLLRSVQAVGLVAFAFACLRARSLWCALALGSVPTFLLLDMPCYYSIHLLALCLLARARPKLEAPLLVAATLTQLAHLRFGWFDDRYTAMSVVVTALCASVLVAFVWHRGAGGKGHMVSC